MSREISREEREQHFQKLNERIEQLYYDVNFQEVTNFLRNLLGIPELKITYQLRFPKSYGSYPHPHVEVESENLIEHSTLMKFMCSELYVDNFGGGITEDIPRSLIREDAEEYYSKQHPLRIWIPLHFSYRHHGGGTNGCEIAFAEYSERTGDWKFESEINKKRWVLKT